MVFVIDGFQTDAGCLKGFSELGLGDLKVAAFVVAEGLVGKWALSEFLVEGMVVEVEKMTSVEGMVVEVEKMTSVEGMVVEVEKMTPVEGMVVEVEKMASVEGMVVEVEKMASVEGMVVEVGFENCHQFRFLLEIG